ncbi:MAG: calcium/sodium antiporter [Alphaproteobacteria bacterium]|nr:calcium/sodium antiporter [Alphaproteobacteria bacterium]MBR6010437.1 calcium/sodium antiporter [Alphaproteobacteria bacterium]
MILSVLLLISGFILLIYGAHILVDGATALARKFDIPEIVIGLTVVACGTSAPEAAVSISSVISGNSAVGVGNILGSNIVNIFVILGLSALVANLHVKKNTILYDIPFLSFVSLLLLFMGWRYGVISRAGSLLFCGLFVLFMLYLYKVSKKHKTEIPEPVNMSIFKMLLFIVFGIATLIIGAKLIVNSATNIAHFLNIPERVIGLTIVAFGTSLPELVTCVVAAFKRRSGIVIGNIVGSNLFNILFVLGVTGLIQPIPFEHAFILDAALGVIATILLWILVFKDKKFNRTDGIIFLLIYITYTVLLVR